MAPDALGQLEVWFVTGSQDMYGAEHAPRRSRRTRARSPPRLDAAAEIPGAGRRTSPSRPRPESIRGRDARGERRARLHRRDRLDAHVLAGEDVDRRASARSQKPLLHLHTQFNRDLPWAEIDMDFMNLNQSAHGDREFGFIETRMRLAPEDGRRALDGAGGRASGSAPGRAPPAAGTRRSGSQVARFGDNMRQVAVTEGDKVEAQIRLGFSVNGYGVGDLVAAVDAVPDAEVDRLVDGVRGGLRRSLPALRRGGERRESLRDAARIEVGLRAFLDARRLQGLHRHLRGPRTA